MQDQSETSPDARGLRIALVVSRYHGHITGRLEQGAEQAYRDAGGATEDLFIVDAAGAFELTAVCRALAEHRRIDAIVAIACVITGETEHDRYLCHSVVQGLTDITVRTGVPVAFGVLTCQTLEQARSRAGGREGNKGTEAMIASIRTARTVNAIRAGGPVPREGAHVEAS